MPAWFLGIVKPRWYSAKCEHKVRFACRQQQRYTDFNCVQSEVGFWTRENHADVVLKATKGLMPEVLTLEEWMRKRLPVGCATPSCKIPFGPKEHAAALMYFRRPIYVEKEPSEKTALLGGNGVYEQRN